MATQPNLVQRTLQKLSQATSPYTTRAARGTSTSATTTAATGRTPVYFVSHGGVRYPFPNISHLVTYSPSLTFCFFSGEEKPNIMYQVEHPAFHQFQKIGKEITTKVKPKAVVVFSAHWQAAAAGSKVEVNTAEFADLIYDYNGFPDHYYKHKYPNVGSQELAEKVLELLEEAGIESQGVKRGLDHGVFTPFTCMFDPEENPLGVPVVQVSLFGQEDPNMHYALGRAVSKLRDEGVYIISGSVLPYSDSLLNPNDGFSDLQSARMSGKLLDYVVPFDEAIKEAVTNVASGEERKAKLAELLTRSDARNAHPTFEHLLPVHIASGAAGGDNAVQLWTLPEMSMSWAQYRFGEVQS
ncbi:unnamed protein product [Tuber aestivum]|uniref:Extradiol ring-cleavage dioxygenase class III enzyme subunit B domain-containing protein n=1 Tax=Tuber aestivum TaxID=59557 RepID=A0A292PRM9_9PEZI|nr:unnamed protein product [Tuber aestivum]